MAVTNAGLLGAPIAHQLSYAAPLAQPIAYAATPLQKTIVSEEYDPNPQYSYGYDVQDALTGDFKNKVETRNGDVVQGSYSLIEPDGNRRIVEYTADPINGFNAVVRREPAVQAKVATPVSVGYAAPLAYSTPLLHH